MEKLHELSQSKKIVNDNHTEFNLRDMYMNTPEIIVRFQNTPYTEKILP